jgi:hypothetical protein
MACRQQAQLYWLSILPTGRLVITQLYLGTGEAHCLSAQTLNNFLVFGEATGLIFRKDELPIRNNIKDAVVPLDQLRFDTEFIGDSGRQTGGLWKIVSGYAIGNRNFHIFYPSFCMAAQQLVFETA